MYFGIRCGERIGSIACDLRVRVGAYIQQVEGLRFVAVLEGESVAIILFSGFEAHLYAFESRDTVNRKVAVRTKSKDLRSDGFAKQFVSVPSIFKRFAEVTSLPHVELVSVSALCTHEESDFVRLFGNHATWCSIRSRNSSA